MCKLHRYTMDLHLNCKNCLLKSKFSPHRTINLNSLIVNPPAGTWPDVKGNGRSPRLYRLSRGCWLAYKIVSWHWCACCTVLPWICIWMNCKSRSMPIKSVNNRKELTVIMVIRADKLTNTFRYFYEFLLSRLIGVQVDWTVWKEYGPNPPTNAHLLEGTPLTLDCRTYAINWPN